MRPFGNSPEEAKRMAEEAARERAAHRETGRILARAMRSVFAFPVDPPTHTASDFDVRR